MRAEEEDNRRPVTIEDNRLGEEGGWETRCGGASSEDRKWLEIVFRHGQRKKDGVGGGGEAQAARGRKVWELFGRPMQTTLGS